MLSSGEPVSIPSSSRGENYLFNFAGLIKLTMKQFITLIGGLSLWGLLGTKVLGVILDPVLSLLLLSVIFIPLIVIIFVQKDKLPYEYYLANKLLYHIEGEIYTLRVSDSSHLKSYNSLVDTKDSYE